MAIDIKKLKQIAKNKVNREIENTDDLIEFLSTWWSNKYQLPSNHPLFLAKTLEELVVDYYVDKFISDPKSIDEEERKKAEEDWLKKEMGDEYHEEYDYLVDPNISENEKKEIEEQFPNIKEEF